MNGRLLFHTLAPLLISVALPGQPPLPQPLVTPKKPVGRPAVIFLDLRKPAAGGAKRLPHLPKNLQGPTIIPGNFQPIDAAQLTNAIRNAQAGSPPPAGPQSTPSGSPAQTPPAPLPTATGTFMSLSPTNAWVTGKGGFTAEYPIWFAADHLSLSPLAGHASRLNFMIQAAGTFLLDFVICTPESGGICTISTDWAAPQQITMNAIADLQHLVVAVTIPPKPADVQTLDWGIQLESTRMLSFYSMTVFNAQ